MKYEDLKDIIQEIYDLVQSLNIKDKYKIIVFEALLNKLLQKHILEHTITKYNNIKESAFENFENKDTISKTFSEYLIDIDTQQIKYHYQRVAVLLDYLASIGYSIVDNLIEAISEYFPQVGWPIPKNIKRDTLLAYKNKLIVCKDLKNLKDCYLTQYGKEYLASLLKT